jgi:hypothetical protein
VMSLDPASLTQAKPARRSNCSCGCATRTRRYPSDLTDAPVGGAGPAAAGAGLPAADRSGTSAGSSWMRSSTWSTTASSGGHCRPTFHPGTVYGAFARWCADLSTAELVDRLRGDQA